MQMSSVVFVRSTEMLHLQRVARPADDKRFNLLFAMSSKWMQNNLLRAMLDWNEEKMLGLRMAESGRNGSRTSRSGSVDSIKLRMRNGIEVESWKFLMPIVRITNCWQQLKLSTWLRVWENFIVCTSVRARGRGNANNDVRRAATVRRLPAIPNRN